MARRSGASANHGLRRLTENMARVTAAIGSRLTPRAFLVAHVVATAALFLLFGGYRNELAKIESDGKYYYQFLLSAWFDGDLDFSDDYAVAAEPFMARPVDHYGFQDRLTSTGRPTNLFTTGPAILWVPFFAVTHLAVSVRSALGGGDIGTPTGWELHFQYAVMFSAVVYSTLTLVMLFDLLRRSFSERTVIVGLALTFWSTNWAYYTVFEPSMSHVYDVFTMVLLIWTAVRAHRSGRIAAYAVVGLAAGLHVLVRTQNLLTVAIVVTVLVVASHRRSEPRIGLGSITAMGSTMAVTLIPLAVSNAALFGSPFVIPQGDGFLDLTSPEVARVLFSRRNGLFSHHPTLLVAAAGLVVLAVRWRRRRRLVLWFIAPLTAAFVAQVWVNASAADWWGGHAFGQRRLVVALPLFAIGFCGIYESLVERFPTRRRFVQLAAGGLIVANLWLTLIHVFMWSYDEPHDILHWMFVRGPEWVRVNGGLQGPAAAP